MKKILSLVVATFLIGCAASAQYHKYVYSGSIDKSFGKETAAKLATLGQFKDALYYWDNGSPQENIELSEAELADFQRYQPIDATAYILERAAKEQIVVLNELSHVPYHRAFAASLLQGLYSSGYRYLFAECVQPDDSLNIRKYPLDTSGTALICEPYYADFIRQALSLGFEVISYRTQKDGLSPSEKALEEVRIIHRTMRQKPDAKVLVYANFADAMKKAPRGWDGTLAMRIELLTRIKPFTIDQVIMTEKSIPENDNPYTKAAKVTQSSVMVTESNTPFVESSKQGFFDVQIFHPRTEYYDQRPRWMAAYNSRSSMYLSLQGIKSYPIIVDAYIETETGKGVIPVDHFEVNEAPKYHPKTKTWLNPCAVWLPKGQSIKMVYKSLDGKVLKEDKVRLN